MADEHNYRGQNPQDPGHLGPENGPPIPEPEFVPFVDKVIAFALLALPFSALLVWAQEGLSVHFSKQVTNIVLLIGIVTFLLTIGSAARVINHYRTRGRRG